jgi:hypothetical protein
MLLGQNPSFEGKTRGIGRKRDEIVILGNNASAAFNFLPDDVAKNATFFINKVLLCAFNFFRHIDGNNGQRNQLAVRVFERSSRGFAMVLKNENVFEAAIFFEVKNTVPEGPQYIFNALGWKRGQAGIMIGRLNNHLVRPNPIHFVEHAIGLTAQVTLNA